MFLFVFLYKHIKTIKNTKKINLKKKSRFLHDTSVFLHELMVNQFECLLVGIDKARINKIILYFHCFFNVFFLFYIASHIHDSKHHFIIY